MLHLKIGNTIVLGVDRVNIERLQAGQDISVNLKPLGIDNMLFIRYGETLADVKRDIEEMTGAKLPDLPINIDGPLTKQ